MSKGLEAFKELNYHLPRYIEEDMDKELDTIEKELKALEIIKEKRVNMLALMHSIRFENLEFYNAGCFDWDELTKEEWEFLKEVLGNDNHSRV